MPFDFFLHIIIKPLQCCNNQKQLLVMKPSFKPTIFIFYFHGNSLGLYQKYEAIWQQGALPKMTQVCLVNKQDRLIAYMIVSVQINTILIDGIAIDGYVSGKLTILFNLILTKRYQAHQRSNLCNDMIIQLLAKEKRDAFSMRFTEQEKLWMMGFSYMKHLY